MGRMMINLSHPISAANFVTGYTLVHKKTLALSANHQVPFSQ